MNHKELLIKDLCARLPYGVKLQCTSDTITCIGSYTLDTIVLDRFCNENTEYVPFDEVKPYLFPLSSMTKKQYKEWCDLSEEPLDDILNRNANGIKTTVLEHHLLFAKSMIDPIQWCYKNHFDIYGLIPMGLAIDATNLNIYG